MSLTGKISRLFAGVSLAAMAALSSCTSGEDLARPDGDAKNLNEQKVVWETGMSIAFDDLAEAILPHADILFIGELHGQKIIHDRAFSEEAVAAYKKAGVTQLLMEETTETSPEMVAAYVASIAAAQEKGQQLYHSDQTLLRLSGAGITPVSVDPASAAEKKAMLSARTIDDQATFLFRRYSGDSALADNMINAHDGEKNIALFGLDHGSSANDGFPERFAEAGITMIKIDVYSNARTFEINAGMRVQQNAKIDELFPDNTLTIGAEVPQLVYFAEEGRVFLTSATPEPISHAINALSAETNTPQPR